jgi:hypothetical protein
MYHSNFWLNLHGIWEGWPLREVDGVFKWYYLVQWGFWIQQILVVNIEEKRKDYAQMLTHHLFTTALLFLSYGYYHMRVGTVILCIMDFVDIILPVSASCPQTSTPANFPRLPNSSSTWATPPPATSHSEPSSSPGSSPATSST